ncbi:DUF2141 domain-containing protein [Comamonas endophytica]|uniref:DUF2141 domain-containing protein n=1 Tax=Comamonas endophytica TaxID=2949090 RepID=A0ABY6GEZ6_9BURK|nr:MULTISPECIES: DUF2141 domain-containing protein [unclassified Acidovorax]MCD2513175.1 DUF2141 domain-containing protein [Acidovorax sp. D4N7]UYG53478.1 DUF2141 domain-containing protein [Acidovorax sp. 5MLIR]
MPAAAVYNAAVHWLGRNSHAGGSSDYNEDGYPAKVRMRIEPAKPAPIIPPDSTSRCVDGKGFTEPSISREKKRGRLAARWGLALALISGGIAPAFAADLQLNIDNVPTVPSRMYVALYDSAESMKANKPLATRIVDVTGNQTVVVFPALATGTYAFVAFADENSNGELDTNFIGIPTERYGFSNNAMGLMGPPGFDAASVRVEHEPKTISIKLR